MKAQVQPAHADTGVRLVVNPIMGTKADPGIEKIDTDLMVLSLIKGNWKLTHGLEKIDVLLEGRLSAALSAAEFTGEHGQFVVLDGGAAGARKILIMGIGNPRTFSARHLCELLEKCVAIASANDCTKITLAIMPNRSTELSLSLKGSAATIRCRLHLLLEQGETGSVEAVELFCTPQAGRFLVAGIGIGGSRCADCPFKKSCA